MQNVLFSRKKQWFSLKCGLYLKAAYINIWNHRILLRLLFESGFNSRAASKSEFTVATYRYVNYITVLITPLPELWVCCSVHDYSNFEFIFSSHKKQPNIWCCLSIKLPNDDRGSHIVCNSLQNAYAARRRHEQIDGLIVGVHEKRAVLFKKTLNLRIKTTLFFMLLLRNPYKKT